MPKHGDIDQTTGMVFWSFDSDGRERWFDPARFFFRKNAANARQKHAYWANHEQSKTQVREWAAANRSKKRASFTKWRKRNLDKVRDSFLRKTYGISSEQYQEMLVAQNFGCAICGTSESAVRKASGKQHALCVDHCHATGKVRGLLCVNCNIALGKFKDNTQTMQRAIDYLKAQQSEPVAVLDLTSEPAA
jgi:hypothetical protein